MSLSQSKEKIALKLPTHSWPFCLRELRLFTCLNHIFCTFPDTDSSQHPERQYSLKKKRKRKDAFLFHTRGRHSKTSPKQCAACSGVLGSHLAPQTTGGGQASFNTVAYSLTSSVSVLHHPLQSLYQRLLLLLLLHLSMCHTNLILQPSNLHCSDCEPSAWSFT